MNPCTLHPAGDATCHDSSQIEIEDRTGARAWACVSHAIRATWAIEGARVVRDLRTEQTGASQ